MKTNKKRSQWQEKSVAKEFNAKVTVASGAKWGMKADVRSDRFLIECKTTEKDSYRITPQVWNKISKEATRDHIRTPILIVDLEDKNRYVVFNPKDFNKEMYSPYECSDNNSSSYLLKDGFLEECNEDMDKPVLAKLFRIGSEAPYKLLAYMHIEDFVDYYSEELYGE